MSGNFFKTVMDDRITRAVFEIVFEYPLTITGNIEKKIIAKEGENFDRSHVRSRVDKITENRYFAREIPKYFSACMFPQPSDSKIREALLTYSSLNSRSSKYDVLWKAEKILRALKGDQRRSCKEIADAIGLSTAALRPHLVILDDGGMIITRNNKVKLDTDKMEKISKWHDEKVDNNEFLNRLTSMIDEKAKISGFTKDGTTYYKVKLGGESAELCANPMKRYIYLMDNLSEEEINAAEEE